MSINSQLLTLKDHSDLEIVLRFIPSQQSEAKTGKEIAWRMRCEESDRFTKRDVNRLLTKIQMQYPQVRFGMMLGRKVWWKQSEEGIKLSSKKPEEKNLVRKEVTMTIMSDSVPNAPPFTSNTKNLLENQAAKSDPKFEQNLMSAYRKDLENQSMWHISVIGGDTRSEPHGIMKTQVYPLLSSNKSILDEKEYLESIPNPVVKTITNQGENLSFIGYGPYVHSDWSMGNEEKTTSEGKTPIDEQVWKYWSENSPDNSGFFIKESNLSFAEPMIDDEYFKELEILSCQGYISNLGTLLDSQLMRKAFNPMSRRFEQYSYTFPDAEKVLMASIDSNIWFDVSYRIRHGVFYYVYEDTFLDEVLAINPNGNELPGMWLKEPDHNGSCEPSKFGFETYLQPNGFELIGRNEENLCPLMPDVVNCRINLDSQSVDIRFIYICASSEFRGLTIGNSTLRGGLNWVPMFKTDRCDSEFNDVKESCTKHLLMKGAGSKRRVSFVIQRRGGASVTWDSFYDIERLAQTISKV